LGSADEALAPLSTLQQLTALHLPKVTTHQLAYVKLPGLLELVASLERLPRLERQEEGQQVLQLGHMSSLTLLETHSESLLPSDILPLSACALCSGALDQCSVMFGPDGGSSSACSRC
jgi:hypothetical protein